MTSTSSFYRFHTYAALAALLSLTSIGCGSKGTDEEGEAGATGSGATGGSASGGSGGSSGSGGTSGTGATSTAIEEWNFDEDLEGWDVLRVTGGSTPESLAAATTAEWSGDEGYDDVPGSVKMTIPFDDIEQSVVLFITTPTDHQDMTGRKMEVRVKLGEGLTDDASNPGGAQPFAKGGPDYVWAEGGWQNLGPEQAGAWVVAQIVFEEPGNMTAFDMGYDPTQVMEFGVKIGTGSLATDYHEATVYIDAIRILEN
jgi:hypothetical protein